MGMLLVVLLLAGAYYRRFERAKQASKTVCNPGEVELKSGSYCGMVEAMAWVEEEEHVIVMLSQATNVYFFPPHLGTPRMYAVIELHYTEARHEKEIRRIVDSWKTLPPIYPDENNRHPGLRGACTDLYNV